MRWKIETFHKILKSGFKAEEVRLRAAERIVNLIAKTGANADRDLPAGSTGE
jgi:hypothetical protein